MRPIARLRSRIETVLAASMIVLLIAGFWLLIGNRQGALSAPGTAATADNTRLPTGYPVGYPGPVGSPTPTGMPVEPTVPPTATLLPDVGIRLNQIENLSAKLSALSFPPDDTPHFAYPSTDGKTLVGIVASGLANPVGSVVIVDMGSGTTQKLADVRSAAETYISDHYVLWNDLGKLMSYDRQTGQAQAVATSDVARDASLSGSIVAWENLAKGQSVGIMAYDLATGQSYQVVRPTATASFRKPLVSGRWVVYENIYEVSGLMQLELDAANMDTGETLKLGKLPYSQGYIPPLYGIDTPWVAWTEWSGSPDLQLFNLDTRESLTVTAPSCELGGTRGDLSHILISRGRVLFAGCFQDMGYDLDSSKFFSIPIRTAGAEFSDWTLANDRLVVVEMVGPKHQWQTELLTATISGK